MQFEEIERIQALQSRFGNLAEFTELGRVPFGDTTLPITGIVLGSKDRAAPTFGLFGGVHGLEHIGTQVIVAYLEQLASQLKWDRSFYDFLENCRLVTIPLVNPGGFYGNTRSNPQGVDLNRNAPVESDQATWLVGGHRLTPKLPWYRGPEGGPMEMEAQVLVDFVKKEMFEAKAAIALDVHSGFGALDRIWYPFARSKEPFPFMKQVKTLQELLDSSCPFHVYHLEPQSKVYCTHGDLWDYLFDLYEQKHGKNSKAFIPLTLEMGSWIWVKKRPWQLFRARGVYNPMKPHRYRRVVRRHLPLMDFLTRVTHYHSAWAVGAAGDAGK